jgi:hypothetical protein
MTVGSRHSALIVSITRSGVGIGVRCLEGRHDYPGPFEANDLVERPAELRGPASNEEPDGARPSVEVGREVPGRLR